MQLMESSFAMDTSARLVYWILPAARVIRIIIMHLGNQGSVAH